MTIVLNGQERTAQSGESVLDLMKTLGFAPGRVAVEVNGRVLHRHDFGGVILLDGDRVEVVQFVGGG